MLQPSKRNKNVVNAWRMDINIKMNDKKLFDNTSDLSGKLESECNQSQSEGETRASMRAVQIVSVILISVIL